MTSQEQFYHYQEETNADFYSMLANNSFNDRVFDSLLDCINNETLFTDKLFELTVLNISKDFDTVMYSTLLEAFHSDVEKNPNIIKSVQRLMALRFADRIKEAIKRFTPEYYNFLSHIDYYDERLLPLICNTNESMENSREKIESVLRDKAVALIANFLDKEFPEIKSVINKLSDEIISIIIPSILEYNRTTIEDKEVIMGMILNPEKLFTLHTENTEMSQVIVQTLLEEVEKKRNNSEESLNGREQ